MNSSAIYSKSGKGVQEASGKTSILSRADRAVLSAIDGRATLAEVAQKCGKAFDASFEQLIAKLDKDGFVREASPGIAPPAPKPPPKPAAKAAAKPAGKAADSGMGDLDFSSSLDFAAAPKAKPAAPPPPEPTRGLEPRASEEAEKRAQEHAASLVRARQEAEARAQKDRDRIKGEAEAKLRAEAEARLRAEAAAKGQADIEAKLRAESDAKVKAARDAAVRAAAEAKAKAEAEMKAKVDAERKAREEAERKAKDEAERVRQETESARKEAEEKAAREAAELKRKLEEERARAEAERKAREEAERKAREAAERARKEAEEKARAEAEAMRKQLEDERRKLEEERKREAEERKRREEEDRKRREAEDRQRREEDERRRQEDEARRRRDEEARAKEAEERRRRDAEERERREAEERERAEAKERREAEARTAKAAAETAPRLSVPPPPPPAAEASGSFDAGLLADLDSFGRREEEEAHAKEEAARKAKEAAERKAREEEERGRREAEERRRREEDERRREEEEARRAREEEERARRDEEERERRDAEERKRRAKETLAAAQQAKAPADEGDIGVRDEDLDMDDVKQDERALSAAARREAREREAARAEAATRAEAPEVVVPRARGKPVKWGKLVGIGLVVLVVAGLGALQVMPLSASDYEKAASAALGRPVRIGSANLSVFSGMKVVLHGVTVDDVKLGTVSGSPELGSIFGERKVFNRIDLESPVLPPSLAGAALFGKAKGGNFSVRRVVAHKVKLDGTLALPALDADLTFGDDGGLRSGTVSGPDGLNVTLTGKDSELEFDLSSSQFTLPIAPDITLSTFGMKGSATQEGLRITSWDAVLLDGRVSGTANLRWGSAWTTDGSVAVHGINAAVFAPTLLVEGKADGSGRFSASSPAPEKLGAAVRVDGNFTVGRGVLGAVDLSRAIQSGGHGATGSTPFNEINGQGVYDKGAIALRNVNIAAGNLNAGAAVDIAASGALSGRIVVDVKTASATLRATVNLGGTVKEPQVR